MISPWSHYQNNDATLNRIIRLNHKYNKISLFHTHHTIPNFVKILYLYEKAGTWNADKISFLNEKIYIGDFVELFSGHLARKQVWGYIEKLVEGQRLKQDGDGKMRSYSLSEQYESRMAILSQAVEIGLNAMNERSKGQK